MLKLTVTLETIRRVNQDRVEGKRMADYSLPEKVRAEILQTRYSENQINQAFAAITRTHATVG
ncbi:hypothetical protein [Iodobacter ciconiae]|uniref:Uncharacterized protein n=1 Tax=Iodobacter ciconiae TaxID=2496266 RepID=A0A3S8ZW01_9NEIS|nr:hypothetical protein [Iodobacter ciconiae]AZN37652.1 hypothetical protein EJO50_14965 [Iodobacter ciconiae]